MSCVSSRARVASTAFVAALTSLLALPALVATASAAQGGGKPDLVVKKVRLNNDGFAFIGDRLDGQIDYEVVNRGGSRAGASTASIFLRGGGKIYRLDRFGTKPLESGKSEIVGLGVDAVNNFPAGEYVVGVCADVKDKVNESKEGNNCKNGKPKFYSTYRTFKGFVGGKGNGMFGSQESWITTSDTTYGPGQYVGGGLFFYKNTGAAAIRYRHHGSSGGCTYSGEGTFAIDGRVSQIVLNYKAAAYSVNAATIPGSQYTVTATCADGSTTGYLRPVGGTPALIAFQQALQFEDLLDGLDVPGPIPGLSFTWGLNGV